MSRTTRFVAGGAILIAMVLLAHGTGLFGPDRLGTNGEPDHDDGSRDGSGNHESVADGVPARGSDPAFRNLGWKSDALDHEILAEVLQKTASSMDLMLLDLEANAELVPWLDSLVADDDFGQAVAECRNEYERQQKSPCIWYQDVILKRDAKGDASVAAVQPRIAPHQRKERTDGPLAPECRAWAQCVSSAWKGRPGLFPQGVDDYVTTSKDGSEFIAIRTGVHHRGAYGSDSTLTEYQEAYEEGIAQLEEKTRRREQAYIEAEDTRVRSKTAREGLYYHLLLERGRIDDYRAYLRYLAKDGS